MRLARESASASFCLALLQLGFDLPIGSAVTHHLFLVVSFKLFFIFHTCYLISSTFLPAGLGFMWIYVVCFGDSCGFILCLGIPVDSSFGFLRFLWIHVVLRGWGIHVDLCCVVWASY